MKEKLKSFFMLVKALASSSSGFKGRKNSKGRYSKASSPVFVMLLSGLIMTFSLAISTFSTSMEFQSQGVSQAVFEAMYHTTLLSDMVLIASLCTSFVFSVFFLSKSDEFLLPLPIEPFRLFWARCVLALLYIFPYSLLPLVDSFIYFYFLGVGFGSYLLCLVIYPAFLITIVGALFIIWNFLGRLLAFKKHQSSKAIAMWLTMIPLLGVYIYLRIGGGEASKDMVSFYNSLNWVNWLSYLPSHGVLLTGSSWLYCLLQLLLTAGVVLAVYVVGNHFYINNIGEEGLKKKKALSSAKMDKAINTSFKKFGRQNFGIYWNHELSLVRTNMAQLMAMLFLSFCYPMIMVAVSAVLSKESPELLNNSAGVFALCCSTGLLGASFPYLSYISVSLEGKSFYVLKTFPLDKKKYLAAKIAVSILLNLIILGFTMVLLITLSAFDYRIVLLSGLYCLPAFFIISQMGLSVGLRSARFDWDVIQELTQSNWNGFLVTVYAFLLEGAFVGVGSLVIFLISKKGFSFDLAFLSVLGMDILGFFLFMAFTSLSEKRFEKLLKKDI